MSFKLSFTVKLHGHSLTHTFTLSPTRSSQDRDTKQGILNAKTAVHDAKVTAHVLTESSLAAAIQIEAEAKVEAAANLEDDTADCAASFARQNAANVAQAKKDQAYLDDALSFVGDLRERITGFQDEKASMAGAALIQLSVTDKHQLRTLVHAYGNGDSDKWDGSFATEDPNKLRKAKYLNKARLNLRADQITAILEAMAVVEGRINAEKGEVSATAAQTAKDVAKDAAQCKTAGKCYCIHCISLLSAASQ